MNDRSQPELSVIVPLYNEEECVKLLHEALHAALDPEGIDYELLFVDDGSADATAEIAAELTHDDPRLRVIRFRRNCGQTPAMAAGIDYARGKVLVTMDGDLQNDPADIPYFLEKMQEGYDIVVGWRYQRQDKFLTRKLPSRIANWLIGVITGVPIRDNGCSLKAYRGDLIKRVPLYSEMHRFIPAMASVAGSRIAEIRVRHHARQFGESKYGLSRIYKVLLDLLVIKAIVSFTARPMLWFAIPAIPAALLSVACFAGSFWTPLIEGGAISVPLSGTGLVFAALSGFLLLGGVLGELIHRTGDLSLNELSNLTLQTHLGGGGAHRNRKSQQ